MPKPFKAARRKVQAKNPPLGGRAPNVNLLDEPDSTSTIAAKPSDQPVINPGTVVGKRSAHSRIESTYWVAAPDVSRLPISHGETFVGAINELQYQEWVSQQSKANYQGNQ